MVPKYQSIVLLAALTIASCGLSESRGIRSTPKEGDVDKSILNDATVRKVILNGILKTQGTSQQQLQEIITEAKGNLGQIVNGINSELKEDIVRLDGDAVRINAEGLKKLLQKFVEATVVNNLPPQSALASTIQSSVSQQLASESTRFSTAVARSAVPLDVATQLARKKRSLEPRDLGSDIESIVGNIIVGILGQQLSALIVQFLESIKSILQSLIIVNAPGNAIGDLLAGIVNFLVTGALQVITVIEQSLVPSVSSQAAFLEYQAKSKRDLGSIIGDVANGVGDAVGDVVGDVVNGVGDVGNAADDVLSGSQDVTSSGNGLLDGLLSPIFSLIADLLTPVNTIVKDIVTAILSLIQPLLGSTLVSRFENLILALIDFFIPTNSS